ncbi:MAG: hypothetical protein WB497_02245, partial [Pseudolabrys sp.]
MMAYVASEGRLFALKPSEWGILLGGVALCGFATRPDRAGWRGLAGKKKARKLGLKTTPTYEIGWQTAYYKTAALPLS